MKTRIYDYELEKMFDNVLDETLEEVKVGDYSYLPSKVLKSVDKIAYHQDLGFFIDGLLKGGEIEEGENDGEYYKAGEA